jgi:CBS domain containing-hemolysin-like protein
LVGEIRDEHDVVPEEPVKKINAENYEFDGIYLLEDANEFMDLPYQEHEESTVGGYVFNLLGHEPKVGDVSEDKYCKYEVMRIDNMRITRVHVTVKNYHEKEDAIAG